MLVSCETCRRSYHGYCLDPMPVSDGEWVCPYAGSDLKHKTRSKRTQNKLEQAEHLALERRNTRKTKYGLPLVVDFVSGWLTKEMFLRPPAPPSAPVESARGKRTSTPSGVPTGRTRGKRTANATTPTTDARAKVTTASPATQLRTPTAATLPPLAKATGHGIEHGSAPSTPAAAAARSQPGTGERGYQHRTSQHNTPHVAQQTAQHNSSFATPLRSQSTAQSTYSASSPRAVSIHPDFCTEVMMDKHLPNFFVASEEMLPLGSYCISTNAQLEAEQIKTLEKFCNGRDRESVWLESRQRVSEAATDLLGSKPLALSPKPATDAEEYLVARSATLAAAGLVQSLPRSQFDDILIPGLKRMLGDGSQMDLLRFLAYQRLEQIYRLGSAVKAYDQLKRIVGVEGVVSDVMPGTNGQRPSVDGPPPHMPPGRPIIYPSKDGRTPITNFGGIPLEQKILAQQRYTEAHARQTPSSLSTLGPSPAHGTSPLGGQMHQQGLFRAPSTPHAGVQTPSTPSTPTLFSTTTGHARTPQTPSNLTGGLTASHAQSQARSQPQAQNGTARNLATISGTLSDFVSTSPLSQNSGLRVHYGSQTNSNTPTATGTSATSTNSRKRPNENPEEHAPGTKAAKASGQATPQASSHAPQASSNTPQPLPSKTVSIAVSNADWEALVDQGISAISQPPPAPLATASAASGASNVPGSSPTAVNQAALASRLQDMQPSAFPQSTLASGAPRPQSNGPFEVVDLDAEDDAPSASATATTQSNQQLALQQQSHSTTPQHTNLLSAHNALTTQPASHLQSAQIGSYGWQSTPGFAHPNAAAPHSNNAVILFNAAGSSAGTLSGTPTPYAAPTAAYTATPVQALQTSLSQPGLPFNVQTMVPPASPVNVNAAAPVNSSGNRSASTGSISPQPSTAGSVLPSSAMQVDTPSPIHSNTPSAVTPWSNQPLTTNDPANTSTSTISRNSSMASMSNVQGSSADLSKQIIANEKAKEKDQEKEQQESEPNSIRDAIQREKKEREEKAKEKMPAPSMETPKKTSSTVSSETPTASTPTPTPVPSTPSATPSSVETPTATPQTALTEKPRKELKDSSSLVIVKPAVLYTSKLRSAAHQITTAYWTTERLALAAALKNVAPEMFSAIRHREEDLNDPSKKRIYGVLLGVVNEDNTIIGIPLFATNSIGREAKDVILGELGGTKISRAHATLTWKPDTKTWLLDVQGKHGVRVNEVPNAAKATIEVKDGDMLMFSSTRLVIRTLNHPIAN